MLPKLPAPSSGLKGGGCCPCICLEEEARPAEGLSNSEGVPGAGPSCRAEAYASCGVCRTCRLLRV